MLFLYFFLISFFSWQRNGFFVECGALDGELGSTSLFFERMRNWTGLLVEADPENYRKLKHKNRKAFTVNACLSPTNSPGKVRDLLFKSTITNVYKIKYGAQYMSFLLNGNVTCFKGICYLDPYFFQYDLSRAINLDVKLYLYHFSKYLMLIRT